MLGTVALPTMSKLAQEYPQYLSHHNNAPDLDDSSHNDEDSSHGTHSGYDYNGYNNNNNHQEEFVAGSGSDIPSHSSDNDEDGDTHDDRDTAEEEIFEDEANLVCVTIDNYPLFSFFISF